MKIIPDKTFVDCIANDNVRNFVNKFFESHVLYSGNDRKDTAMIFEYYAEVDKTLADSNEEVHIATVIIQQLYYHAKGRKLNPHAARYFTAAGQSYFKEVM